MAEIPEDLLTKISTSATEDFIAAYYTALQASRHTISSYYVRKETLPDGKQVPIILWNGNSFEDGGEFQSTFEKRMPYTYYEVGSLNCHVLNAAPLPPDEKHFSGGIKSIMVVVSGFVRLEEAKTGPMKGFSETLVLVPNPEKASGKGPKAEKRSWLIQSQNFRYVVEGG